MYRREWISIEDARRLERSDYREPLEVRDGIAVYVMERPSFEMRSYGLSNIASVAVRLIPVERPGKA